MAEHISRLTRVFEEVLDLENLELTLLTTAKDIEGWDSIAHVRIIVAIEEEFGLRFSTSEISALNTIESILDLIDRKSGI